jgi:hypothetical protein
MDDLSKLRIEVTATDDYFLNYLALAMLALRYISDYEDRVIAAKMLLEKMQREAASYQINGKRSDI